MSLNLLSKAELTPTLRRDFYPYQKHEKNSNEEHFCSPEILHQNSVTSFEETLVSLYETLLSYTNNKPTCKENSTTDYVVNGIFRHKKSTTETLYQAHWYGYIPSDDRFEAADNILNHFMRPYWRLKTWQTRNQTSTLPGRHTFIYEKMESTYIPRKKNISNT